MELRKVAIIGFGQSQFRYRRDDASYAELVQEAVLAALKDAGTGINDIQAVVFSLAPDSLIGIGNAERWCVDAIGASNKPFMRVNTGGSTGISSVQTGYYHIASGLFDCVLVAGADKVGESGDSQIILNKMWDPIYERQIPLNAINMLALSAVRYMHKYGMTERHMAMVTVKNRKNASKNPYAHLRKETTIEEVMASRVLCWPIKLFDACPQSSGGAAMILASEELAKRIVPQPAWIKGVGHSSETYYMGDRMGPAAVHDHADAFALGQSFSRAYAMAGIKNPAKEVDVAELYAPCSNTEYHAIDAAGLCKPGESINLMEEGYFNMDGPMPVNPSGGTLCTNPIAVTAMVRVGEAALQVMGKAGERQVKGARTAIANGNGGDHQFFGTMVLGQEP
ncbi:MAG: thiolase family protein [Desulfobacterales bacterium]|nr:thiolase family protein [Desulfobacterales bacterium]